MDLVPVLQRALLQQQYQAKPCHPAYMRYLENLLLSDDSEEEQEIQHMNSVSYELIIGELSSLIAPASAIPPKLSNQEFRCLLLEGARAAVVKDASRIYEVVGRVQSVARETQIAIVQGNLTEKFSPFQVVYLHFADALVAKLAGTGPQLREAMRMAVAKVELGPICTRGHASRSMRAFTREMILTECKNAKRLHIVEFGSDGGYQWPCLIQALSEHRKHNLEYVKITSIDFPKPVLKINLKEYANSLGVTVYHEAISSRSWDRVTLCTDPSEVLIVTCSLRMMYLPKPNEVLENIFKLKPFMFMQCEFSSNIDNPFFLSRFEAALRHYEACYSAAVEWPKLSENIQARILDIVACEGGQRQDRRTTYKCWDERARRAGFEHVEVPQAVIDKVSDCVSDPQRRCEMSWPIVKVNEEELCGLFAWKPVDYLF